MRQHNGFFADSINALVLTLLFIGVNCVAEEILPAVPLAVNSAHAATTRWLSKPVLATRLLDDMEDPSTWTLRNHGQLSFTQERCRDGRQSVRITVPTLSDQPNKVHGRAFGEATLCRVFDKEDWTAFNRLSFWVFPTMKGFKNGSMLAKLFYEGSDEEKVSLWYRGQMNYFLLQPGQWNHIVWEIPHVQRQKVTRLELIYLQQGNEPGADTTVTLDIDHLELQRVEADYYQGWGVAPGRIAFSHSGYQTGLPKRAFASGLSPGTFSLLDQTSSRTVLTKPTRLAQTGLGEFQVMDFSEVEAPGIYTLKTGDLASQPFRIGPEVWELTIGKAINFFYAERCGYAVPGVHDVCHQDWQAKHQDQTITINGGWHDAGDLSQGEINTAEATYSMLALADRLQGHNPDLVERLMTEARWGLSWLHKTRFGDGFRVVWGTMDFWTDGVRGNIDDCLGEVRNSAYENLIGSAASALAARLFKQQEPALAETSLRIAREDFRFALEKAGASRLEMASQIVLAAVELFRATGDRAYADKAVESAKVIIASQQRELPDWDKPMVGFFYDGPKHERILNFAHRGHDQAPVVALAALCDALPEHEDWIRWYSAVVLNSEFLRATARLDEPYGTLAAGIYHVGDSPDQVTKGLKLSKDYYLRRFPVTTDARGHFGVLLSQTKGLSAAARLRNDPSLIEVCQSQLQWIVGRNPFGQSCMYGEGYDYAPQYTAMSGDIVGSLPVGIMMPGNEDFPFWPAANCWAYKEVWVHPVSRWLWVLSDLLTNRALRPDPPPDCTFTLAAQTSTNGQVTISLSAQGRGHHRFTVRSENLTIGDASQELDLGAGGSKAATWTAPVVNSRVPWVAVVIPDGNLSQRREVTSRINPP
jgi:hypothetical protein